MSSSPPLLTTKLFLPTPRTDIVPRPRLVEKLQSGLTGKVTVVSAPAGYGKTTLISDWAQRSDRSVSWLSLDEKDNDLPRFLRYLIKAIQQINSSIGKDVLDILDSPQITDTEILLTLLVNDLATVNKEFALVLDDCHVISSFEIFDALEFLIENQPPAIHFIFIGRLDPSITLSRLRVTGDLTEIRSTDLQFTKMESTVFLNDSMNLDLSIDEIIALERSTEGWIAGLQLAGLSLQQREDKSEFIHSFSSLHRHIFDYLMDEVLSNQPKSIREFLFQTSILEKYNASLCDSILEIDSSAQIIQKLDAANLFVIPLNDEREWFRYHHLFRDFLEVCLQDNQPELVSGIHKRAAKWYADHDYDYEAFNHLILAEEFETASSFLELKAISMLEQSEFVTLLKWVVAIPMEFVDQHIRLRIYQTWALRLGGSKYDIVESKIKKLHQDLDTSATKLSRLAAGSLYDNLEDEYRNLRAHLFGLQAFQGIYSEKPTNAIEMAGKAKELQPDENFVLSSIDFALGWAHRLSGDLDAAYQAFLNSSDLSFRSGNLYMAVSTLCRGAYGQVLKGRLSKAEVDFQRALRLAHLQDGRRLPVAGYAYGYLSGINYEWNNLDITKEYALEGIKLSERVGLVYDQVIGYCYLSRAFLAQRDVESAQDACDNAEELSLQMGDYISIRRWVEDCQVRIWVDQGDIDNIERWMNSSDLQINVEPDYKRDIDHIILARTLVALAKDRPKASYLKDAIMLLSNLEKLAESAGWYGKLIEILALQCKAFLLDDREENAIDTLEKAILLAEPEGYLRTFVDEGKPMHYLLQKVSRNESLQVYIRRILALFEPVQLIDQEYISLIEVEPLSSRELDVMKMLATDLSGPEISKEMNIALSTLRFHTRNIYGKLMVNNRRSAVRKASESDLI